MFRTIIVPLDGTQAPRPRCHMLPRRRSITVRDSSYSKLFLSPNCHLIMLCAAVRCRSSTFTPRRSVIASTPGLDVISVRLLTAFDLE